MNVQQKLRYNKNNNLEAEQLTAREVNIFLGQIFPSHFSCLYLLNIGALKWVPRVRKFKTLISGIESVVIFSFLPCAQF